MRRTLLACPGCGVHVKPVEAACPHCGATMRDGEDVVDEHGGLDIDGRVDIDGHGHGHGHGHDGRIGVVGIMRREPFLLALVCACGPEVGVDDWPQWQGQRVGFWSTEDPRFHIVDFRVLGRDRTISTRCVRTARHRRRPYLIWQSCGFPSAQ